MRKVLERVIKCKVSTIDSQMLSLGNGSLTQSLCFTAGCISGGVNCPKSFSQLMIEIRDQVPYLLSSPLPLHQNLQARGRVGRQRRWGGPEECVLTVFCILWESEG